MATILKIVGSAAGAPEPPDGPYIIKYDPTLDETGAYTLVTTADPCRAKRFDCTRDAIGYYRQVCPNHRFDTPGHLNRPITHYSVSFEPAPEAGARDAAE